MGLGSLDEGSGGRLFWACILFSAGSKTVDWGESITPSVIS